MKMKSIDKLKEKHRKIAALKQDAANIIYEILVAKAKEITTILIATEKEIKQLDSRMHIRRVNVDSLFDIPADEHTVISASITMDCI